MYINCFSVLELWPCATFKKMKMMYKFGYLYSPSSFVVFSYNNTFQFKFYIVFNTWVYHVVETQHTLLHISLKEISSRLQAFFTLTLNGVPEMNHTSKLVPTVYSSYRALTDHAVTSCTPTDQTLFLWIPTRKKQIDLGEYAGQKSHVWGVILLCWNLQ